MRVLRGVVYIIKLRTYIILQYYVFMGRLKRETLQRGTR